eukprot:symbB.v1.2.008334.t1/scaffold507.1/size305965/4
MLDLITIFSAAGLQQEMKAANGDKSLMIREESDDSTSFVESAANGVSAALEVVDNAVAQGFDALFGTEPTEHAEPSTKKL